jgi:hypothetical protein
MPLFDAVRVRGAVARAGVGRHPASALAAVVLAALACNPTDVLKVPEPDNLQPGNVNSKEALPALRNATLSAFQIAYSGAADDANGGHEGQVNLTGLFVDELVDDETFTSRIQIDARSATPGNGTLNAAFIDISSARAFADKADVKYNQFDAANPDHALVLSLGGFLYTMFAENYCEGVPVSTLNDNGTITYGVPLTRQQLLATAVQRFDSAVTIAQAAGDAGNVALAQVGLARALLDSNDDASAAIAAAAVPETFTYQIGASTNTLVENNGIWNYTFNNLDFGMSDVEGGNGLAFVTANDPRVPALDLHQPGFNRGADFVQQQLYPLPTSSITLASGVEAQLIVAEHQLRTGNPGGFKATLDALRATVGLGPTTDPGTTPGRQRLLFSERAFWMYLTAHRLGDLRRMVRQYGFDQSQVFPVGTSNQGQPYGSDVNFPVSADEQNNPNFHGCLNRNA